jgi:FtsH-binding integral membrane protein
MNFRRNTTDYARMQTSQAVGVDQGLRAYMLKIYNYMASALALTGVVALAASQSEAFTGMLYSFSPEGYPTGMSLFGYVIAFAPLVAILGLSFGINRMSASTAQACFWGFAVIMGLSMTGIFLAYTGESIARTFFITAGTFGAMSIYGYTTKRDLTGVGSFLIMGVWGLLLASIVNIFMQSSALGFAISAIGVLIFTGLTAYDTQKLKSLYYQLGGQGEAMAKASIMGALTLYLDFINLFIMLLRFIGERR